MIDKIWYDWQNLDPVNANSFNGGSVEEIDALAAYNEFPNGGAPYLNVSTRVLQLSI
jgi:tyrosinase